MARHIGPRHFAVALPLLLLVSPGWALSRGEAYRPVSHEPSVTHPRANASLRRWSRPIVTYRDGSGYRNATRLAVRWINDLPSPLTLRRASSGAQVVIRRSYRPDVSWAGRAYYPPWGDIVLNSDYMSRGTTTLEDRAEVIAHELLHAVGVPHIPGCTLMDPGSALYEERCRRGLPEGMRPCGPQVADLRAVVHRYGGTIRGFRGYRCGRERSRLADVGLAPPATSPTPEPPATVPAPLPAPADPESELLLEGWETGMAGWHQETLSGAAPVWAPSNDAPTSGAWAVSDSPDGLYVNDSTSALVHDMAFDVTPFRRCSLSFSAVYDLEQGYDFLDAEVGIGGEWRVVSRLTGTSDGRSEAVQVSLDLATDVAGDLRLRFVLHSDPSIVLDGVSLDDVRLACQA